MLGKLIIPMPFQVPAVPLGLLYHHSKKGVGRDSGLYRDCFDKLI